MLLRIGESGWCTCHHPRLPPLRPGFDPGLVRGLWLVDLNLTPRGFLWVLRCFSLHKNQLSRQNLCRRAYWTRASGAGDWVTTPNTMTFNKPFAFALQFLDTGPIIATMKRYTCNLPCFVLFFDFFLLSVCMFSATHCWILALSFQTF